MIHEIILNGYAETYSILSKAINKCKLESLIGKNDDYGYFNHVKNSFEKLAKMQFIHRLPNVDKVNEEKAYVPKFSCQARPERFIVPELKFDSKLILFINKITVLDQNILLFLRFKIKPNKHRTCLLEN
jgi:hypothetical protein